MTYRVWSQGRGPSAHTETMGISSRSLPDGWTSTGLKWCTFAPRSAFWVDFTGNFDIIIQPGKAKGRIPLALRQNIPGLANMVEAGLAYDQVQYIFRYASVTSSRSATTRWENTFMLVPYEEEGSFVVAERLYGILTDSRDITLNKGMKEKWETLTSYI